MKKFTMFNLRTRETFIGTQEEFYNGKSITIQKLKKGDRYSGNWVCVKEEEFVGEIDIIEQTEVEQVIDNIDNEEPIYIFKHDDGDTFHGTKEEFMSNLLGRGGFPTLRVTAGENIQSCDICVVIEFLALANCII